jgi:hypothetical protein
MKGRICRTVWSFALLIFQSACQSRRRVLVLGRSLPAGG